MKLLVSIIIGIIAVGIGYYSGSIFSENHIITLQRSGDTLEIIPIIDGNQPIDCPEGYRVKAVGYWDKETHYRCLLIQLQEDCLDTEAYFSETMTCIPTDRDQYRLECGDRYFLDSKCHSMYVKTKNSEIYSNERGEFYKFDAGIITSDPSKNYSDVFLLIPIESDYVCTFKKQGHYAWCGDYFKIDGVEPYTVDICADHNYNGIRISDGYCIEVLVMDYVDDFNIAYKEQKLKFIDWKIFDKGGDV